MTCTKRKVHNNKCSAIVLRPHHHHTFSKGLSSNGGKRSTMGETSRCI
jgi:hypothetical protein